jgi:hypothetical protein
MKTERYGKKGYHKNKNNSRWKTTRCEEKEYHEN